MKKRNPNWLRIDPKEPIAVACWKGVLSKMTYQEFLDDIGAKTSVRLEALWEDAEETLKNLGPNEWADIPWEYPDPELYGTEDMYQAGSDVKLRDEFLKKMGDK
jgi:hypothetical protein